jgi:hypothetical protein
MLVDRMEGGGGARDDRLDVKQEDSGVERMGEPSGDASSR